MSARSLQVIAAAASLWVVVGLACAADFPLVHGIAAEAVIVPAAAAKEMPGFDSFSGHWTPSATDIQQLEERLAAFLRSEAIRPGGQRPHVAEVSRRIREYRRQYVGVIAEGKRLVLLNAFPKRDAESEFYPNWRREFVAVSDGGASYWKVFYDPQRKRFESLAINGPG